EFAEPVSLIHVTMIRSNGSDLGHVSLSKAGSFTVAGLRPGEYSAIASVVPSGETGIVPFVVSDHDVTGLKIIPRPVEQVHLHGTFRMADNGSSLPKDLSILYSDPNPGGQSEVIAAANEGQFSLTANPGNYSVRPVVPAGYAAVEIRYGGANQLNSLF